MNDRNQVGFVSWQRVSVACFPPNNITKNQEHWGAHRRVRVQSYLVNPCKLVFAQSTGRTAHPKSKSAMSDGAFETDASLAHIVPYLPADETGALPGDSVAGGSEAEVRHAQWLQLAQEVRCVPPHMPGLQLSGLPSEPLAPAGEKATPRARGPEPEARPSPAWPQALVLTPGP